MSLTGAIRAVVVALVFLCVVVGTFKTVHAQRVVKYGTDFMSTGVGGRALGMGGAYVGLADDLTAGYWNPAGLNGLDSLEVGYMHAERFAGLVSFDYGGVGLPVSSESAVALSVIRSGVNNIKNTLNAWDPERNQPLPNAEDRITTFSAADYAVLLGYGRKLSSRLSLGVTGKVVRRSIGDFASAWGYSLDAGARYKGRHVAAGVVVRDLTTMLQSWSVNQEKLGPLQEVFNMQMPKGGAELTLPVVRIGTGVFFPLGPVDVTGGADVDVAFDGQRAYAANIGDVSFHPRLGGEVSYKDLVALRAGVNRLVHAEDTGYHLTPTVGAGVMLGRFVVGYSFGDFAGMSADLGYSHRVSLRVKLGYLSKEKAE